MAGEFQSPSGNLENILVSDYNMIDQYVGGSLWTWGANIQGQLGNNSTNTKFRPTIATTLTTWTQIATNDSQSSAGITTDGTLWMWGYNIDGQLGTNNRLSYSTPTQTVAAGTNWKQVVLGGNSTGAIKTDGTLWVWGQNFGKLGDGTTANKSSPVQTVAGGTNWKQVSCGSDNFGAIKTDGTLWVWGDNTYGSLGTNDTTSVSSPVQTIAAGTNWKQVSCGKTYIGAIKTDGTLWIWGRNNYGQLGTNDITDRSSPVQTVAGGTNWKQLASGENYTAAIKTDGTLWVWGSNSTGQLGTNDLTDYSSPVQTVAGGNNWKQVDTGNNHMGAIKKDGTLWMWGQNITYGALGDNTTTSRSSPVQTIAAGTNWKQISLGQSFSMAIYNYDADNQYPTA